MPIRSVLFGASVAIIPSFALMGVWSVRMALADYQFRQETLPGTEEALRLEPDSAAYDVRLAGFIAETNPAASLLALQHAVALNPWDSQSWVELGLRAESAGDLSSAERSLLRAASVDKQYLPKWSLLNYYFRHGEAGKFWFWARESTGAAYGDLAPLFNLCWKASSDGAFIDRQLDIRKADAQASYLTYLTSQNRIDPMTRAAGRLLAWNRPADVPALLAACDRLIKDDRADQAISIWNKLAELHRIPDGILAPSSGSSLTNGDFTNPLLAQSFDWRLPDIGGIAASLGERPTSLRISFSGQEPEECDLLAQFLPVLASSHYELRFLYRTAGIAPNTGVAWKIADLNGSRALAQGESLESESEKEGRLSFATPSGSRLVRLTLTYQRALGTTRIEGFIVLRKLVLRKLT